MNGVRPWEPGQPSKYLRSLRAEITSGRDGRLLVIAGVAAAELRVRKRMRRVFSSASSTATAETIRELRETVDTKDRPLMGYATWNEIAGWAFEAGKEDCGSAGDWLAKAGKPSGPGAQRLLAELIWYLEGEGYAMASALGQDMIAQAPAAFALIKSIENLTADVCEQITAKEARIGLQCVRGTNDTFKPPESSWLARWDARIYIGWDQAKEVSTEAHDKLASEDLVFVVGVDIRNAEYEALERKARWEDQVREAGLSFDGGTPFAVFDPKALREATTLDQQGAELGRWATEQIKAIIALRPGRRPPKPTREAKKRRRRRLVRN